METLKVKWDRIVSEKPICNWIDLGNGTMFLVSAFRAWESWEMAKNGLMVAIDRVGSFLFTSSDQFNYRYVSEKLYVCEADARNLADWITAQVGNVFSEQQGRYSEEYIENCDEFYNGSRIIRPVIVREK